MFVQRDCNRLKLKERKIEERKLIYNLFQGYHDDLVGDIGAIIISYLQPVDLLQIIYLWTRHKNNVSTYRFNKASDLFEKLPRILWDKHFCQVVLNGKLLLLVTSHFIYINKPEDCSKKDFYERLERKVRKAIDFYQLDKKIMIYKGCDVDNEIVNYFPGTGVFYTTRAFFVDGMRHFVSKKKERDSYKIRKTSDSDAKRIASILNRAVVEELIPRCVITGAMQSGWAAILVKDERTNKSELLVDGAIPCGKLGSEQGKRCNGFERLSPNNVNIVQFQIKFSDVGIVGNEGEIVNSYYCAAMVDDKGNVWVVGKNVDGALGLGFLGEHSTWQNAPNKIRFPEGVLIKKIDVGRFPCRYDGSVIALAKDGSVFVWGHMLDLDGNEKKLSYQTMPKKVVGLPYIIDVAIGSDSVWYALDKNGKIWTWGYNTWGQLGLGESNYNITLSKPVEMPFVPESPVVQMVAGPVGFAAVLENGDAYICGSNRYGGLGLPESCNDMDDRDKFSYVGTLKKLTLPKEGLKIKKIVLGSDNRDEFYSITVILATDGTVWLACGKKNRAKADYDKQYGHDPVKKYQPVQIAGLPFKVKDISCVFDDIALISEDDVVYSFDIWKMTMQQLYKANPISRKKIMRDNNFNPNFFKLTEKHEGNYSKIIEEVNLQLI